GFGGGGLSPRECRQKQSHHYARKTHGRSLPRRFCGSVPTITMRNGGVCCYVDEGGHHGPRTQTFAARFLHPFIRWHPGRSLSDGRSFLPCKLGPRAVANRER